MGQPHPPMNPIHQLWTTGSPSPELSRGPCLTNPPTAAGPDSVSPEHQLHRPEGSAEDEEVQPAKDHHGARLPLHHGVLCSTFSVR